MENDIPFIPQYLRGEILKVKEEVLLLLTLLLLLKAREKGVKAVLQYSIES